MSLVVHRAYLCNNLWGVIMVKISKIVLSFILIFGGLTSSFVLGMEKSVPSATLAPAPDSDDSDSDVERPTMRHRRDGGQPAMKNVWQQHARPFITRSGATRAAVGCCACLTGVLCLTCLGAQAAQYGDTNDSAAWTVWVAEALGGLGCCALGTWSCCGWPSCGCCSDDEDAPKKDARKKYKKD